MNEKSGNKTVQRRKRIFLMDQSPIVRLAVAQWLAQTPGMAVCGHSDQPAVALKAIEELKPDIVVTEIPAKQDLKFIETLHKRHPRLPILVFSFRDEVWYAPKALEAGAHGYLLKSVTLEHLIEGIRGALKGRLILSPDMRYRLLSRCVRRRCGHGLPGKKRCPPSPRRGKAKLSTSGTVTRFAA